MVLASVRRAPALTATTLVVIVGVIAACGGTEVAEPVPDLLAFDDSAAASEITTAIPSVDETHVEADEADGVAAAGSLDGPFDVLAVGDCWDLVGEERPSPGAVATTIAPDAQPGAFRPCDEPHQHETFARAEIAASIGEDYPGLADLEAQALADVCEPAVVDFAGEQANHLPLRIWAWFPSEGSWDDGDRTIVCTVGSSNSASGATKVGTAAGGSLDSDETIVVRAFDGEVVDWFLTSERGALFPLTGGTFTLPPSPPFVVESGLLFAAPQTASGEAGADGPAVDHFTFLDFDDLSIARVSFGGLGGWEVADPQLTIAEAGFVLAAREDGQADWDLYRAIGVDLQRLTTAGGDERWPRLLPDEQGLVYNVDGAIWIMELDGENQRPLTAGPLDFEPAVSPDGTRIAFTSARTGDDEIWIANVDGTGLRNLTEHPANDSFPFWLTDGEYLYFQTDRLGDGTVVMMMTADGKDVSYFGQTRGTVGAVVPPDSALRLVPSLQALPTRERFVTIAGSAGELGRYVDSTGRLEVSLPAGWGVVEIERRLPDATRTVEIAASPDLDRYFDLWDVAGVAVSVIEGDADVHARSLASVDAAGCDIADRGSSDRVGAAGQRIEVTSARFECAGAPVWVLGEWDERASLGLIYEVQGPVTEDLVREIVESVSWS